MQSDRFKDDLSSISLKELEVLLESDLIQIKEIEENQIKSQHQLLIHLNQLQQNIPKEQLKTHLFDIFTKLLNDEFKNKKSLDKKQKNEKQEDGKSDMQEDRQNEQEQGNNHQQVYNDESRMLSPQIYEKIHSYFPYAFQLIDIMKVNHFNYSHSSDILDLVMIELQLPNNFKQSQQIISMVNHIVLPIIHMHPDFCIKGIQVIKSVMNYFDKDLNRKTQVIDSLSQIVTFLCLSFTDSSKNPSIHQIISIMTAVQAIHSKSQTYPPSLTQSKLFHSFIFRMLLCSNVDSKTGNSIAVNMYGALLKQLNLYCNEADLFINLYSTLRCFGAHLVKDIWPLFYDFIEIQGNDLIFSKAELIDIIFYKIQHHENANVVKHCIQSILQEQRSFILFNTVPDAIFNSLMRILNYGMHYLDCMFHMDSKMFPMISSFFSNFFNNRNICKQSDFERQMKLFLKAIYQKITFDHALVAMLHSFTLIERKSCAIGKQEIEWISTLIRKYYVKYPMRKKHQMMNGMCCLLKNHLNTEKKRQQLNLPKSQNLIDLHYWMKNCLNDFPQDYIQLKLNGQQKKEQVYEIITQNFTKQNINQSLKTHTQSLEALLNKSTFNQQSFSSLIQSLRLVQFIFYLSEQKQTPQNSKKVTNKFDHFQVQTVEQLSYVYSIIYERFVADLGQSLYKCKEQRLYGIHIQKACLEKIFPMKNLIPKFDTTNFIQSALTNVSFLVKECIESDSKQILSKQDISVCQYIVKKSFQMIYEFGRQQGNEEMPQKASRSGSQFLQWATDHIEHTECNLLILTALKIRIQESYISPIQYIEQSVYNIFCALFALENKVKLITKHQKERKQHTISQEKLNKISPLYRLRLLTLCGSILFYDDNEVMKFYSHMIGNIEELADRYDFENLDQILYFVELIFTCQESAIDKKIKTQFLADSPQTYSRISKVINSIIQTMLIQLNYGVDSKEVISCSNSVLNIMFDFAFKFNHFSPQLVLLAIKVLEIGQEYWMFQRMITFKTIQNLSIMLQRQSKISYKALFPLLSKILSIEEYRGYDSAVVLQKQLAKEEFYTDLKLILHQQSDYEGLTCRLGFVEFVNILVEYSMKNFQNNHEDHTLNEFLNQFFVFKLTETKKDTSEKMFMTGQHKHKLKLWQCMLAYHPEWVIQSCKNKSNWLKFTIEDLIIDIIEIVDKNNNIFEVKYYIELFLMKLMINEHSEKIISIKILDLLSLKLLELASQANKNVSFIFISGSIMNYMFRTYQIIKSHPLYESLQKLYNAVLIYSCSHVAYFRGLSQYFCLKKLFIESQYTRILHQVIGKDTDTILLKNKLNLIVKNYFHQIQNWNVRNNLFKQLPTLSGNIISQTFYMDRLKKLGHQLLRQIKPEIGFLPYKQIWLEAVKTLKLTNEIEIDIQKESLINTNGQQQAIFQRKIDPSLDFIYFSKTKMEGFEMKILITGSKQIPLYGHLSRTGQIFGLSQLIIPCREILEDEEFKNVACTAEKWLNISWFSNKQEMENRQKFQLSLEKQLLTKKQEGYTFFLLKKHENISQQILRGDLDKIHNMNKILLILDSQDYLPTSMKQLFEAIICFGKYFSQHVEASIFTWEYFKQIYGKKFRNEGKQLC